MGPSEGWGDPLWNGFRFFRSIEYTYLLLTYVLSTIEQALCTTFVPTHPGDNCVAIGFVR